MQLVLIDWLSVSDMGSNSAHKESYLRNEQAQSMQRSIHTANIAFPLVTTIITSHLSISAMITHRPKQRYYIETRNTYK